MDELFPIESVTKDTPRLRWLKKYGLEVFETQDEDGELAWICWNPKTQPCSDDDRIGKDTTQHGAIADWAIKNKVRLWNEEVK